jgi:hypothetical protein
MALKKAGVKSIPVVLRSKASKGYEIRWSEQTNPKSYDYLDQAWPTKLVGESGGEIKFPVEDPRPIKRDNAGYALRQGKRLFGS